MYEDTAFAAVNPWGGVDYAPHNRGVTPVFFIESVLDRAASEKAGRAIYQDLERVRIHVAGDSLSVAVHPVDDAIIDRFEEAYDKWKRKGHVVVNGTPLAKWPMATPSFIKEMEFLNINSVDDLASVADVHLDRMADGRQWRDRAAAWLKSAADGAAAAQYASENARLREDVARLEAKMDELLNGTPPAPSEAKKAKKAKRHFSAAYRQQLSDRMKARHAANRASQD